MNERESPELLDQLMASGFVLQVFMLQVSLEIARSQPDPEAWAKRFFSTLHARVDGNEERIADRRYPVHELARGQLDQLGAALSTLLTRPPAD